VNTTNQAWEKAKEAATWLRKHGAKRVLVFGSLATKNYHEGTSDIDIYFEGLPNNVALEATGHLLDIFGERTIDPLPSQFCPTELREQIESEGVLV
jgi:predicted nucleotidyltransferase